MIPKFRAFDKINKVMLYEIDNLGECRVSIDEMDWEYLEKEQIPKNIHRDCPLRKHEVKGKKEGDA